MPQQSEYCKETNRDINLFMNIWEDEYSGKESLKAIKCVHQRDCEFHDSAKRCPTINQKIDFYSSKKEEGF